MSENRLIPAPKGLGARARRFWKDVLKGWELRPDELVLLETACRTLDRIDQLEAAMADAPLTVKGSMGQEREHPLLSETRQQRALLNHTLKQLGLPDSGLGRGNQHRDAAAARWASRWAEATGTRI